MRYLTGLLLLLFVLLQYDLWVGEGSLASAWRLQQEIEQQQQENQALKERNAALFAEVDDLKQGYDAIEERARSELGMVGKDETFYQIISPPDADSSSPAEQ